jgi:hypothetical protein
MAVQFHQSVLSFKHARYLKLASLLCIAALWAYFGIDASNLDWSQSALLSGLVQSTSTLNPYTNPDGALVRRNLVLDTMIDQLPDKATELRAAKQKPLGILPRPNELPRGCIPRSLEVILRAECVEKTQAGDRWGALLQWVDADGRSHEWAMSWALLAGDGQEIRRTLLGTYSR